MAEQTSLADVKVVEISEDKITHFKGNSGNDADKQEELGKANALADVGIVEMHEIEHVYTSHKTGEHRNDLTGESMSLLLIKKSWLNKLLWLM